MSRIAPITEPRSRELAASFERYIDALGFVPNSVRILQRRPQMAIALGHLIAAAWGPDSTVDAGFKRLISYMASHSAGCQYCVAHQVSGALHLGVDERKLAAIWDYQTSSLYSIKERIALDFAVAAAAVPNRVTDEAMAQMQEHWSDDEIVEIAGVIAVFGFLNRFNDTMATPLEPEAIADAKTLIPGERWHPGKHATLS